MSATRTILTGAAVLFLVAAFLPTANAQTGLVDTELDTSGSEAIFGRNDDKGLARGNTDAQAFASVKFCWKGAGAFNPEGLSWTLKPSVTGPEWAEVRVATESLTITPKTGPEGAAGCLDAQSFTFMGGPKADAENGTVGDVVISWTIEGPDQAGTYKKPAAPADVTMKLYVEDLSDDPLANLTNGEDPSIPDGGDDTTSESPAPVAPLLAVLALAGLAVVRRRL